ncbi:unnamed protein product, partial [Discosporangium mesarthrocarpum]
ATAGDDEDDDDGGVFLPESANPLLRSLLYDTSYTAPGPMPGAGAGAGTGTAGPGEAEAGAGGGGVAASNPSDDGDRLGCALPGPRPPWLGGAPGGPRSGPPFPLSFGGGFHHGGVAPYHHLVYGDFRGGLAAGDIVNVEGTGDKMQSRETVEAALDIDTGKTPGTGGPVGLPWARVGDGEGGASTPDNTVPRQGGGHPGASSSGFT